MISSYYTYNDNPHDFSLSIFDENTIFFKHFK